MPVSFFDHAKSSSIKMEEAPSPSRYEMSDIAQKTRDAQFRCHAIPIGSAVFGTARKIDPKKRTPGVYVP